MSSGMLRRDISCRFIIIIIIINSAGSAENGVVWMGRIRGQQLRTGVAMQASCMSLDYTTPSQVTVTWLSRSRGESASHARDILACTRRTTR